MKRTQAATLVAGATLGLAGVTLAVVLSRKQGREAARQLLAKTSTVRDQARRASAVVAKTAVEQYQAQAPRALDALNSALAQAPQAAEALSGKLPKLALNHKRETVEVEA